MEVHDRKFATKLLGKKGTFPIYINHMSYLGSNMLSKIFYASVGSEVLHIARTTTDLINIMSTVNVLLIWMKKAG